MMNILQILNHIASDSKRTHKLAVIEQNKDNELFKEVLNLALNPYVNFFIKAIPTYVATGNQPLKWALSELNKLCTRQFTGHAGIAHLKNILSNLSADDAIVIERIIAKDLRAGFADSTVNSVIPKFIPTYPCLLAKPFDEKSIKHISYPAYSELKADGLRVNFHVNGDQVTICGRSGRPIDLLGHTDNEFVELAKQYDVPMVFDGELVVVDNLGNILSRKVGNGIINKAIKGTITDQDAVMVRVQLWDAIPMSEFHDGKSTEVYKTRFEKLINAIGLITQNKFWTIPYKVVNSLDEAVRHFEELHASGEEGTILKNMGGIWQDTRSKDLVKFKSEKEADLEITGWNEGKGQFTGQVGSLVCASSDRKVQVDISGFTFAERLDITKNIDSYIGKIITIKYNERIGSKGSGRADIDSLFLPRFVEHRLDKTIANSSAEIK